MVSHRSAQAECTTTSVCSMDKSHASTMQSQTSVKGSTISFHGIRYTVNVKDPQKVCHSTEREILRGIDGIFPPGMNAIMGPTGGGKSSLLDVLAGRKDPSGLTGTVLIDGQRQPKDFKCMSGYVVQDDVVMGTLSVRENFMFSANLRLKSSVTKDEKKRRVEETLAELGLTRVADSKVGTEFIRGVSGGERKRTNIGMELIISPSVLFLDEPTTGLDANTANATVALLHRLSRRGRTIVLSIHQPRFSIYKLFDSFLFLGRGRTIYHGPAREALEFFSTLGFQCEAFNNPPDFFLDVINGETMPISSLPPKQEKSDMGSGEIVQRNSSVPESPVQGYENEQYEMREGGASRQSPHKYTAVEIEENEDVVVRSERSDELADAFEQSRWHTQVREEIDPIFEAFQKGNESKKDTIGNSSNAYVTSFIVQYVHVTKRAVVNLLGSPQASVSQIGVMIILGFVVGIIYFQLDNNYPSDIQNRVGVFFFMIMNAIFSNMSSVDLFIRERVIFIHENVSGFYRTSAYFFAKLSSDILPMRLIPICLYCLIAYFMVGLRYEADHFFIFLLTLFLVSVAAASVGFFVSATVGILALANLMMAMIFVFMMIFGGLFINVNDIADWLSWLQWFSIFRYGLNALSINELKDMEFCARNTWPNGTEYEECDPEAGNKYLEQQGIRYETAWDLWANEVALCALAVAFMTLAYVQLRRIKRLK